MKIIITAGGTAEAIDSVRTITNMSTGSLGVEIVKVLIDKIGYEDLDIYFIGSSQAINLIPIDLKALPLIHPIIITDTKSVEEALTSTLTEYEIDSVIHAMAVSDYTVDKVYSMESIIKNLEEKVKDRHNSMIHIEEIISLLKTPNIIDNSSKISSNMDSMDIRLKKTPKLIDTIKQISPNTQLIGFKLMNNVSTDELIKVARDSLIRTNADFIIANDLNNIKENHIAYIVDSISSERIDGKSNIATRIVDIIKR